jgi:hypothetical protein
MNKQFKNYSQPDFKAFTPKPPTAEELTVAMAIFCVLTIRDTPPKLDAAVMKLNPDNFKQPIKHLLEMWAVKTPDLDALNVIFISELEFELKKQRQSNKEIKAPDAYDEAGI